MNVIKKYLYMSALILSACSASIEGGSPVDPFSRPVNDFKDKVTGVNLDGSYVSDCVEDVFSRGGRILRWTINGRELTRKTDGYSDRLCKGQTQSEELTSIFRFAEKFADDVYLIEWMYTGRTIGSGSDVLKVEGDRLLIGDGDTSARAPKLRLYRSGRQPAPAPSPTPPPPLPTDFSPAAGDEAEYEGASRQIYNVNGMSANGDGTWAVFTRINDIPRGYSYHRNLFSTSQYRSKMAGCANIETITTKAGAFVTCRETAGRETRWYGNVPVFGIVKIDFGNGSRLELVRFSLGGAR